MAHKSNCARRYTYIVGTRENEGNMAASSSTIRVNSDIKEGASRIAKRFGFDLSSVTRAFEGRINQEDRIPPNLSDPEPNAESPESIREADAPIAAGGQGRSSAADLFTAIRL